MPRSLVSSSRDLGAGGPQLPFELPAGSQLCAQAFADVHSSSTNLVLVCARHHTLIHSQGFRLVLHPDRRLSVATADGVPVLHHPAALPWGHPDALGEGCGEPVSAGTPPPDRVEPRIDLGYVVSVLLAQAA